MRIFDFDMQLECMGNISNAKSAATLQWSANWIMMHLVEIPNELHQ